MLPFALFFQNSNTWSGFKVQGYDTEYYCGIEPENVSASLWYDPQPSTKRDMYAFENNRREFGTETLVHYHTSSNQLTYYPVLW